MGTLSPSAWSTQDLLDFLTQCGDAGYATEAYKISEIDGSTTYAKEIGDWEKEDNYFGGEPFGGREVVFFKGKVVWMMVYYGEIIETGQKETENFLKHVLAQTSSIWRPRGPEVYETASKEWLYKNTWQGTIEKFSGKDVIFRAGAEVYSCTYAGGLVDQRKD
jgi:hypothetical protein